MSAKEAAEVAEELVDAWEARLGTGESACCGSNIKIAEQVDLEARITKALLEARRDGMLEAAFLIKNHDYNGKIAHQMIVERAEELKEKS